MRALDPASMSLAQEAFITHLTGTWPSLVIGASLSKVGGDPFGMYHAQIAFNPDDPISQRPLESAAYTAVRAFLRERHDLTIYLDAVYFASDYDMPPKKELR